MRYMMDKVLLCPLIVDPTPILAGRQVENLPLGRLQCRAGCTVVKREEAIYIKGVKGLNTFEPNSLKQPG